MITSSFSGDIINASLRQLGASSIKEIRNGILYIAKFELSEDLCVTYVFDVTKRDRYFLQRVTPYPISHGDFTSAQEVVEFIRKDIRKFRNAQNSHNFPKFLDTTNAMVLVLPCGRAALSGAQCYAGGSGQYLSDDPERPA